MRAAIGPNGTLWIPQIPPAYPGSNAVDSAYLTNNSSVAGGSYTNILNFTLPSSINVLAISNNTGQAWLVLTNGALTSTTFALGNGGGLELDSGGLFTAATFNWLGTNGVVRLNNNGTLITTAAVTLGNGASSITGTVTTTSSAGQGGLWNLSGQQLTIGNGVTTGNVLSIRGVIATNAGTVIVGNGAGSFGNLLTVSNSSFSSGAVIVGTGAGSYGNAVSVSNGTFFSSWTRVGNGVGASNNTMTFVNSTWNGGASALQIGTAIASSPGNNVMVNGGVVTNFTTLTIDGVGNSLTLSNGAQMYILPGGGAGTYVGQNNAESNNTIYILAGSTLNISGGYGPYISGSWSNGGTAGGGYSNQMVVNGGTYNGSLTVLGGNSGVTVTNGGINGTVSINGPGDFLYLLSNAIINAGVGSPTIGGLLSINGGCLPTLTIFTSVRAAP